ncbi:DEAD/DEAH box helicase [Candidatus Pantoea floridensis]|uniref:DEAD/DEAH box helicase n=1 Tax=Candidatus Pantoea floridensis TaxID=1938870 RepID=UPI000BE31F8F|nr:DEAD/DEAH box helicase [Pantoea floridensis]PIF21233.1 helicase-like protein [Enterobacteriaceae bacterium JKS000233]
MENIYDIEIELYELFKDKGQLDFERIENALILIYRELDNSENYNLCVKLICFIADKKIKDKMIQQLLHDCIVKSRIFMYDDMLSRNEINYNPEVSPQDIFLRGFYTSSKSETTLTKPQKEIFNSFQKNKRLIVSAPTSFGKTRIIREIISHNTYKVIVIIMPTISLLSEAYHDFKNEFNTEYLVSKSSKIKISNEKKYILVLTPERMSVLIQDNPSLEIDFFVMDEVYKADYKLNDERFRVFADVLYRLTKNGADLYLIGPYINDFSKKFREKFHITMLKYDLEIVQKDYYEFDYINSRGIKEVEGVVLKIIGDKYKNLLRVTRKSNVDGKFLIYRYQKRYVEQLAEKFLEDLPLVPFNQELINYLEQNISKTWSLNDCLKKGVAFHHGAMPRHIQDLIIDEFNSSEGDLKYLFCTTSLTEGVNSTAKNVILYDLKIGNGEPLANLDRRNIEGRAGRFMRHFLGRVFYFEKVE